MAVSPADFELYSRATGTPLPRTPQEQMQMAPQVYQFIQNRGYQNPQGFLGQAGEFLAKAALVGGGLALANKLIPYESRNEVSGVQKPTAKRASLYAPSPTTTGVVEKTVQTPAVATPERVIDIVPGNVDQEGNPIKGLFEYEPENVGGVDRFGNVMPKGGVFGGKSNYFSPEGMYGGDPEMIGTVPSRRVRDEFSSSANIPQISEELVGNVGNVGSLTTNLANAVDRSDVWDSGAAPAVVVAGTRGFGPAPAPRAEAEGLRDIEFSMEPPIQRDPSFFNPTGNWGVGDTANLAGSAINFAMDYGPTIVEQGALDIGKGIRDIQKGIDDTSVVINSVYDAGAATRQFLDSTIASLPTSSSQQSAPLETGDQSILIDHPDVAQEGTGSDEVQNNKNHVLHGDESENVSPEEEAFHGLKQFVRGLTGQDSPVDYTTEPSRQDLLNDPNASKEDLLNEMNRRVEGEMAQDGPNKAAYDAKQRLAKKTQMMQDLSALVGEVQSNQSVNDGYEAYQEFEPKKSKTGGGSGVKSLAYDNKGQVVVDYWDRNPEKQTPGGYVSDSYQGAITGDARDELVTNIANPSLMSGNMTQEQMDDYQSLVADEMEAEDTYQEGLRGGRFGRGEGQVSAGKFANKIKQSQQSAIEFLKENSDKLRGI